MTWILEGGLAGYIPSLFEQFERKKDALDFAARFYEDVLMVDPYDGSRRINRPMGVRSQLAKYGHCSEVGNSDPRYDLSYVSLYEKEFDDED